MKTFALMGCINAFGAVFLGAFAAHGLKQRLSPDLLLIFETGVRYHMYAALGLFAVAWSASRGIAHAHIAGWLLPAGILLFSGSLYALALSGIRAFGAIAPLGGLSFLAAWAMLAWGFARS